MSPRMITDGIPATPAPAASGESGGGSGLIFGAPALSGLTNPGLSENALGALTRSVSAVISTSVGAIMPGTYTAWQRDSSR
jgi:hypothetical protein